MSAKKQPTPGKIDRKIQRIVENQVESRIEASFHSGPLPPPDTLKQYDEIVPGVAERIIAMAEKQADHRMGLENKVVTSNVGNEKRGQWFAFILGLIVIGSGTTCILLDKSVLGLVQIIGSLATLLTLFLAGKRKSTKQLEKKRN